MLTNRWFDPKFMEEVNNMKKIALVLTLLLVIGMAGAFAEVGLSGEFKFGATGIGVAPVSATPRAEINLKATVDEFTTVSIELDSEGADWTGQAEVADDPATTDVNEFKEFLPAKNIALDDFRVTSNITGALGIDVVSLSLTAGLFDAYYCNWNYVSRSGEEFYGSGLAGGYLWTTGPKTDLSVAFNLGVAGYSLKYWQDVMGTAMTVAVSGAPIDGLNFLVGYHAAFTAIGSGSIWLDGGYSFEVGPAALTIPLSFVMSLATTTVNMGWSSGVAADIDAFHVAVGVGGAGANMFKDINVEVSTSIVENADIYVIADLDASTPGIFQSVDIGGKYMFGAFGLGAGYVVAADANTSTSIWGADGSITGSGLYVYADLDF
ncbi:MAG: hypothetical protein JEZ04_10390 [Spirochaetales bacterium]|nr:hypothetical protein [Spirochaetales bacterium]